jgi:dimethylargininase
VCVRREPRHPIGDARDCVARRSAYSLDVLIALTREPTPSLARCLLTHVDRAPIDGGLALAQHERYVECLREFGCAVVELAPLDDHPDATFVEDTAIVLCDVAVITRPGAPERRGECASVAEALARHRPLVHLTAPSTLDGGDVMSVGDVLYVGLSRRTNHAGLKELAHRVLEHGYRVKAVEVPGALHLKSACTSLGRSTLLVNRAWISLERLSAFELIDVDPSEPFAANALAIEGSVLMASEFPRTAERVARAGFDVRCVELGELHKAEAGVTCSSLIFDADTG